MKISGEAVLEAPVEQVWNAVLDPSVLVRTIPGCEQLQVTGENQYDMTVTAGVAAIRGTYTGTCELRDLQPHESLVLKAAGAGAPGTISADVKVTFIDTGEGTTRLTYEAVAVVGGMIGGVGQRMLTSVSKRLAGEFFSSINRVLSGAEPEAAPAAAVAAGAPAAPGAPATAPAAGGTTFTAPPRGGSGGAGGALPGGDFVQGVLIGGGLVLAGVLAGALAARRRG
ncbi:Carbon monoxide dehydrogenase subunit G (CoxG) [Nocardioides dokdonensis FR1436]|uniref:Carbon monoxide dehydrogenase subunit G (CoxG) n=1 Tax=Nocardioides dokdonensis FR1436 TaxID=1300347 RepID=A0A1A9GJG4_9ACTN|nr:carbon monoxide dehydrogenase subunit G [Nocardioides dokdonensis]ANH37753.1 Carbon monoxide dehydrogenase subunit G (CoxG) [Nocardioides dokdonensis FR1436]